MVLKGDGQRWTAMFVIAAALAILALLIAVFSPGDRVGGILVFLAFGSGAAIFALELIIVPELMLDPSGFKVRSILLNINRPWREVQQFEVIRPAPFIESVKVTYVGGRATALPDLFGLKASELAALMNEWRARYTDS